MHRLLRAPQAVDTLRHCGAPTALLCFAGVKTRKNLELRNHITNLAQLRSRISGTTRSIVGRRIMTSPSAPTSVSERLGISPRGFYETTIRTFASDGYIASLAFRTREEYVVRSRRWGCGRGLRCSSLASQRWSRSKLAAPNPHSRCAAVSRRISDHRRLCGWQCRLKRSDSGGFTTGTVSISGVPANADILAAFVYGEAISAHAGHGNRCRATWY